MFQPAIYVFVAIFCLCASADKVAMPTQTLNKILIGNVRNQLKTIETSLAGQLKAVEESVSLMQISCTPKGANQPPTKPRVAFQATFSSASQNVGNYATIIFDRVFLNKGRGYNSTTGVFTAPVDGLYVFHWTILTKAGSRFDSELYLNGKRVTLNFAEANGVNEEISGSQMYVAGLHTGDKVIVVAHGSHAKYAYADWSSFSGFML